MVRLVYSDGQAWPAIQSSYRPKNRRVAEWDGVRTERKTNGLETHAQQFGPDGPEAGFGNLLPRRLEA